MIKVLLIFISISCFFKLNAQDTSHFLYIKSNSLCLTDHQKSFGVAAGVAFVNEANRTYLATASIDYFFYPTISADLAYSIFMENYRNKTYSIGFKYWWSPTRKISLFPFIGISYVNLEFNFGDEVVNGNIIWEKEHFSLLEVPIGIRYITKSGLQTSLQLSYLYKYDSSNFLMGPNVSLKLGWRFNLRKGKEGMDK